MKLSKQIPIDEKSFRKFPLKKQEQLIAEIDKKISCMQELSLKLKDITAQLTANTLQISETLLDKPNMTDTDKKNMQRALAYLKNVGALSESVLLRLQEIVYTPTTIIFGETEVMREFPTGGDGIYDHKTKRRFYTSPEKVPTQEGFCVLSNSTPLGRLSDNYEWGENYPGSLLFALIMGLPQDGYLSKEGTNLGKSTYGVIGLGSKEYYEYEYRQKRAMYRCIDMNEEATLYLLEKY